MRFKKYILLSLVLCGFAACSDDNEIEIPKAPVLEKAQLALAIKSEEGAVTKAIRSWLSMPTAVARSFPTRRWNAYSIPVRAGSPPYI